MASQTPGAGNILPGTNYSGLVTGGRCFYVFGSSNRSLFEMKKLVVCVSLTCQVEKSEKRKEVLYLELQ